MTWEEIQKNVNKPIWDSEKKKWRVIDGYKEIESKKYISFTDSNNWIPFEEKDYLKGVL